MPETIDSMTSVRQEIRHFIVENFLFGQDPGLDDGASLLENGIIDSTGVLELVAHMEGIYHVKVKDDELIPDNFDSIDAIVAYLARKGITSGPGA
jgi:acyl carrier protein